MTDRLEVLICKRYRNAREKKQNELANNHTKEKEIYKYIYITRMKKTRFLSNIPIR